MRVKKKHLKDPDFSTKFEHIVRPKKCLHVKIHNDVKAELNIVKSRLQMTSQDIFECLIHKIIHKDPYLIQILNEYKIEKEELETQELFNSYEKESILDDIDNFVKMEKKRKNANNDGF